jgi:hypothetical protein
MSIPQPRGITAPGGSAWRLPPLTTHPAGSSSSSVQGKLPVLLFPRIVIRNGARISSTKMIDKQESRPEEWTLLRVRWCRSATSPVDCSRAQKVQ